MQDQQSSSRLAIIRTSSFHNSSSRTIFTTLLLSLLCSACVVTPNSANVYKASEAQNEQIIRMAVVESVREVTIDKSGHSSGVGGAAGAVLGGIATSSHIGQGNGASAAGLVGAIIGGIAGQHIEANLKKRPGFEITVKLDNGELRAIVQDADEVFKAGERVRLLSSGGTTRVSH